MPVTTQTPRLTNLSYEDLRAWTNLVGGDVDKYIDAINAGGYDVSELQAIEDLASGYMDFYKNGDGTYTVTQFKDSFQNVTTNPIDSNVSTTARGNISQMLNRGKDAVTGKLNISKFPVSGSFANRASYVVGSVGSAIGAVSAGIALGKTIDSALYNANPDFWDSLGLSSINPETWSGLTNGSDSPFAGLLNFILGIDPETGNTQAYMDENTLAYMAYALAQNGLFDEPNYTATLNETQIQNLPTDQQQYFNAPISFSENYVKYRTIFPNSSNAGGLDEHSFSTPTRCAIMYTQSSYDSNKSAVRVMITSLNSTIAYNRVYTPLNDDGTPRGAPSQSSGTLNLNYSIRVNNTNYYYTTFTNYAFLTPPLSSEQNMFPPVSGIAYALWAGEIGQSGGVVGIENQPNANLPDISSWNDLDDVLPSLQQQYPDMFQNPLIWDNVQPDGTNPQLRYIPVPMPTATSNTDTKPISDTQTQTQTVINPNTSTDTLVKLITELSTKTSADSDPSIPPQNPTDTGTGNSPTPLSPSGSASALWSVYHPTQAQVNQFGAWLWTDNIITQIQQVLQNPMEGIITLHKVFAMPVDSGSGTIVVGRLDSQVPSATVTQQYVTTDCGYVDCSEYFGNVFDYAPHTNVSLYLPFIGIVPLNTDDVMRSTLHVTYGVDVFTGACLAMVEVSRDANTVNMYQYAGVASVEYPLTGSVHSGLITGLLGVAGSVAATVATGGVSAPAAVAAVGGLASAGKSTNARASGFSGNSGAMGIKKPYLIIERPQTKVAQTFPRIAGYPTNYSVKLGDCSNHVVVSHVHVEGINATDTELNQIDTLLKSGVIV